MRVYKSPDVFRAEAALHILREHDIEAVKLDKKDSAYHFGEIEIYVHFSAYEQAVEILVNNEL